MNEFRQFQKVCDILEQNGNNKTKLIPILQAIQDEYRYLPKEILSYVATSLDISPAHIFGVATFYSHFTLEPKGKYVVKICDGTACHVKGSETLLNILRDKLQLNQKKHTTDDLMFTLETVSCLGACGLAPVMVINDKVYGQVTKDKAGQVIDEILKSEEA